MDAIAFYRDFFSFEIIEGKLQLFKMSYNSFKNDNEIGRNKFQELNAYFACGKSIKFFPQNVIWSTELQLVPLDVPVHWSCLLFLMLSVEVG